MSWKPSATANDWDRWKRAEVAPPMTIERVTIEGLIQGKRAKLEATQGFIQMQEQAKRSGEALREMLGIASNKALTETMSGNALDHSWRTIERLCRDGLGE